MGHDELSVVGLVLDAVIGGVTVAALCVAIYQSRQARNASVEAERAIVRERRLDYELNLLAEIYKQWQITRTQHLAGMVSALIHDSSNTVDLRFLRAVVGVKADGLPQGVRTTQDRNGPEFARAIEKELDDAISRRLKGRDEL